MNLRRRRDAALRTLAALAAACLAAPSGHAQSYLATGRFRVIAQSGQSAPTDETFSTLYLPALDGQGRASFRASIIGSSGSPSIAVFAEREGQVASIFHPGVVYGTASPIQLNETQFSRRGDFAGISYISFSSHGYFTGQHDGPITMVAADGQIPPGRPYSRFETFWDTVIGNGGHAVFTAFLESQLSFYSGFSAWKHTPGVGLQEIGLSGTNIPSAGRRFYFIGDTYLFVNAQGDVVIPGLRDLNNGSAPDETTIWKHSGGVLSAIVKDGDPAPVGVDGSTFWVVQEPSLDAAGNVAFFGAYKLPNDAGGGQGYFKSVGGQIVPIAYGGQSAPGTNFVFSQFNAPGMNARGDVSFNANLVTLGTAKSIGVFRQLAGGPLELVAKEGDAAPGTGGATFKSVGWPTLSSDGAVAFISSLQGAGVTAANDYGLWLKGPAGLTLVARKGDMIELAPGDSRQIKAIQFDDDYNSADQGALTGLGPGYQAAMLLIFTDDSKAMIATVHAAGDYNGDAKVDGADFLAWQMGVGATGLPRGTGADGNMDGQVDAADLQLWRDALAGAANVAHVPEPTAIPLVMAFVIMLAVRRR